MIFGVIRDSGNEFASKASKCNKRGLFEIQQRSSFLRFVRMPEDSRLLWPSLLFWTRCAATSAGRHCAADVQADAEPAGPKRVGRTTTVAGWVGGLVGGVGDAWCGWCS